MDDSTAILERERRFLLQTYNRYPVVLARGYAGAGVGFGAS